MGAQLGLTVIPKRGHQIQKPSYKVVDADGVTTLYDGSEVKRSDGKVILNWLVLSEPYPSFRLTNIQGNFILLQTTGDLKKDFTTIEHELPLGTDYVYPGGPLTGVRCHYRRGM